MISDSDGDWIGPWVRSARAHKGWTQEALAFELGVSKANVSHWERSNHQPSIEQFLTIWRLTGYTPQIEGLPLTWPFPNVSTAEIASLTPAQQRGVELGLIASLAAVKSFAGR